MTFQSTEEDIDEVFLQISHKNIVPYFRLDSDFVQAKVRGLILSTKESTCLNYSLLISYQVFWEHVQLNQF